MRAAACTTLFFLSMLVMGAAEGVFYEGFESSLPREWKWIRENASAWRVTNGVLQVRIEPGNMWGPANDAKNVLVRKLPSDPNRAIQISVTVSNQPTEQYEQVDLVWYCDDSHMVKIGEELVDGKLSIVMGREEKDRARTIAIIPLASNRVQLRLTVAAGRIRGEFRPEAKGEWRVAGECDLPPAVSPPHVALQCYQGPAQAEHWATIDDLAVELK